MNTTTRLNEKEAIHLSPEPVRDVMTANPVTLREEESLGNALAILTETGFGVLPVVDELGRMMGLVTRSDLLGYLRRLLEKGSSTRFPTPYEFNSAPVSGVMSRVIFSVAPEAGVITAVDEMLARSVHRLYVIDDVGVLVGVVTSNDIFRRLS